MRHVQWLIREDKNILCNRSSLNLHLAVNNACSYNYDVPKIGENSLFYLTTRSSLSYERQACILILLGNELLHCKDITIGKQASAVASRSAVCQVGMGHGRHSLCRAPAQPNGGRPDEHMAEYWPRQISTGAHDKQ
jgi:hypothetical protein